MTSLLKKPSGWIPIVLSLTTLASILIMIAILGIPTPDPNADEGVGAHLFQMWLVLEFFMLIYFGFRWVPEAPKEGILVLLLQVIAVIAACFPVYYFKF